MNEILASLVDKLHDERRLTAKEYEQLIKGCDAELASYAAAQALAARRGMYGNAVFTRGLIEISSYCKNDCLYCGIRKSNRGCNRYRLSKPQILDCAAAGHQLGFRTFVLQGGEDPWFTDDRLCDIVSSIKGNHPDCAITLSMGERSRESYQRLRDAGADRYLLRHETATPEHYGQLHPAEMRFENRMRCLRDLKELGYAVGAGFMVGSPFQTAEHLAADLAFLQEFKPEMCGIGPFVPHHATEFANEPRGSAELTCFLLSLLRLMDPAMLIPATTALGTIDPQGREKGMLAGANVVMPNLSPADCRRSYEIYDNKVSVGAEAAEGMDALRRQLESIGFAVVVARGDRRDSQESED